MWATGARSGGFEQATAPSLNTDRRRQMAGPDFSSPAAAGDLNKGALRPDDDNGMGPDASSPNDTPVGLMSYLNKHISLIALVVSFLAAIFTGWQGYEMREANERADRAIQEAHDANHEARVANENARVANENARKANDALIELQRQQLESPAGCQPATGESPS